jgi:hypothetical protein
LNCSDPLKAEIAPPFPLDPDDLKKLGKFPYSLVSSGLKIAGGLVVWSEFLRTSLL